MYKSKQLISGAIVLIFLFADISVRSQNLSGEWKGTASITSVPFMGASSVQIKLHFQAVKDSGYKVYSYCKGYNAKGRDTTIVARVSFKQPTRDSIYLEETDVILPKDPVSNCRVKMALKINNNKDEEVLTGDVISIHKECSFSGSVTFTRQRRN